MSEAVEGRVPAERRWERKWPRRAEREWEEAGPPPLGTEVDGYRLERRLGEGGQGTVYRARRGGRSYALKFLPLDSPDWAWRELEVRLRLRRVGGLSVESHGLWPHEAPRFLYLVTPYVQGQPLYAWARTKNPTAREVAWMVRWVARQLAQVHAAGVVHRDIKGSNVLVGKKDGRPVLVDFGVGTYVGAPEITSPLGLPGTRHYRSPEALRFRRERAGEHSPARATDDLWALGVVLYWLLTGSYPFDTEVADEGTLADLILKHAPPPPHELNPRVPRALSELCLRMLEKPLEARLPEAGAVERALEAVLAHADAAWDVPLCEQWGPEDATTPQQAWLDWGDMRDKARRLLEYARRFPRRGRPEPLAEASTLPCSPEEPPPGAVGDTKAEELSSPSRARRVSWRWLAWGGAACVLGLMGLLWLWPAPTSEVMSGDSMRQVTETGQEVAGGAGPPEGGGGAAPEKAATPAPVAPATPRKDGTRVRTPQQTSNPQHEQPRKQDALPGATARTCVLVWAAGQLACASPEPQLRPTTPAPSVPPPAECPAGSVETMTQVLGFQGFGGKHGTNFLIDGKTLINQFITVRPGQEVTLESWAGLRRLPVRTVYVGQLIFGEGRVYGRFTQARTPDGQTYSVCFDLYDAARDFQRGVKMEPGSRPDAAIIVSSVKISPVARFE
ncbi:serine/threonine-protein kinase [Archangium gephyra]|uniref:Serine/threonine-protein kinase n=1 Tax=Archangium gephyra TaxID=48 RepID=A0AAC8TDL3_9BACT|nr:serine/threonine-protein kinase [Archangium gephyra]AKJ00661.1 serine/threonine protein kinase [Archangium gephyra]REG20705.1 serine/threonine-protein kinase [Archangium gephyra]